MKYTVINMVNGKTLMPLGNGTDLESWWGNHFHEFTEIDVSLNNGTGITTVVVESLE